jgi:hypothetical protein
MQRLSWTAEIIMKTKPILCAWLLKLERCRPSGQFLQQATRDGRAQRTSRPLSSMLAQSRLPLLTTSDFRVRLLAAKTQARSLEHETSSFAGGPAGAAVPPSQSDVSVSVRLSGSSARLTSSSFFSLSVTLWHFPYSSTET